MNQNILYIELTFENIDYIQIPARCLVDFELTDIPATGKYLRCSREANAVMFKLKPEADLDAAAFDGDVFGIKEGETSFFKRLQRDAITQIKLAYTDKTEEKFWDAWKGVDRDGHINLCQSSTFETVDGICAKRSITCLQTVMAMFVAR